MQLSRTTVAYLKKSERNKKGQNTVVWGLHNTHKHILKLFGLLPLKYPAVMLDKLGQMRARCSRGQELNAQITGADRSQTVTVSHIHLLLLQKRQADQTSLHTVSPAHPPLLVSLIPFAFLIWRLTLCQTDLLFNAENRQHNHEKHSRRICS